MVNTGQPSTACIQCRFRRIKCDATKPHCDRCTRYGIVCPGYPEKGLVFKDDTSVVRERAEKKYEKRRRRREADDTSESSSRLRPTPVHTESSTSSRSDSDAQIDPSELMQLPLLPANEVQVVEDAVASFLAQWSSPDVEPWWDIPDPVRLASVQGFRGDSLATALQAVSLMMSALKQDPPSSSMMTSAAKIYGAALRSINRALQDPDEWLKDSTVLAVILTALFETMPACGNKAADSTTHLRGMMTIINARGAEQFETIAGRRIFLYAYFSWTSNAVPDMAIMPEKANDLVPPLSEEVFEYLLLGNHAAKEPGLRLLPLINRSLLLRATSISMLRSAQQDSNAQIPKALMGEIETLERELSMWNASVPNEKGFGGNMYQLLTMSWYQTHRIFLADLAVRCLQLLAELTLESHIEEIWDQVDAAQSSVNEICIRAYTVYNSSDGTTVPSKTGSTYLYHSSFDYPLLVASMVDTLPQSRQSGIDEARKQCAAACGLKESRKTYSKVLVVLSPDEKQRYVGHRVARHQKNHNLR